jgi:hypothetical protein
MRAHAAANFDPVQMLRWIKPVEENPPGELPAAHHPLVDLAVGQYLAWALRPINGDDKGRGLGRSSAPIRVILTTATCRTLSAATTRGAL